MTLTIGLIGAGRIGRIHGETVVRRCPGAALTAICDVLPEAAQDLAAELGVGAVYDNPLDLIRDPNVAAVAICSASDTHAALITEAARAGRHIFCEKPIALDLATIDRALAAVDAAGVLLQVGFQRRFDPSFREAKRVIASGQVGEPRLLRITSRDPGPPPLGYLKASGGIFLDMSIHDFDMARFLIESEVVEVYATGGVLVNEAIGREAHDLDTTLITLRFANGALCSIDNCRQSAYGYDQRVEWFGSGGRVVVENEQPHRTVVADGAGVLEAKPLFFFLERYRDAYVAEMQAFVQAVTEGLPSPAGGRDGREPAVIGLAARRSVREGRPVRLHEVDPGRAPIAARPAAQWSETEAAS